MVSILTQKTSNQDFLNFIVDEIHNADIVTTHNGEPQAQICDLLLNKDGKLYIMTGKDNPFFKDLLKQPKVIIDGYNGDGTMSTCGFSLRGSIKNVDQEHMDEIFDKNKYLEEIYAPDVEKAKPALRVLEITPQSASFLDHRTKPIFMKHFVF